MLFWSNAIAAAGESSYSIPGGFARLAIDTFPASIGRTAAATPRYRGLGLIGGLVNGKLQQVESIQYLDAVYGPYGVNVDSVYVLLYSGVSGSLYKGYDTVLNSQPSGTMAIGTTHALADGINTTITWQVVEDGLGQLPELGDLRKFKVPIAGLWLVALTVDLPAATYTRLLIRALVAGVAFRTLLDDPIGVIPAAGLIKTMVAVMPFNLNDEVTINVGQTSGGSRNLTTATRCTLARLGDL